MPEGFQDISEVDLWTPLRGSSTGEGSGTNFQLVVRLKPGATWAQARSELGTITEPAFRLFRKREGISFALDVRPMQDALVGGVRDSIVMLGWAVATVLVMACVNLAALLLARGGSRTKEIATRMALGSGRRAIVRQLMVEALLLAMAGGALGMFVGWVGLEALKSIGGQTFEEWTRVTLDGRVLLVSLGLSLMTSLLFGLVPAWQASRVNVQASLADGGSRSIAGSSKHWLRRSLVVAQVALGVAMLVAAGLLLRTFMNLRNLDPGFEPRGLVTASVSMQDSRYRTAESINRLFEESLRRVRATAGVESAAISLELPYERLLNRAFRFPEMAAWRFVDDQLGLHHARVSGHAADPTPRRPGPDRNGHRHWTARRADQRDVRAHLLARSIPDRPAPPHCRRGAGDRRRHGRRTATTELVNRRHRARAAHVVAARLRARRADC